MDALVCLRLLTFRAQQRSVGAAIEPGFSRDIRNTEFLAPHQGGEIAADHGLATWVG